eukprot:4923538-Pleurochrysis_carterae.AAC.1
MRTAPRAQGAMRTQISSPLLLRLIAARRHAHRRARTLGWFAERHERHLKHADEASRGYGQGLRTFVCLCRAPLPHARFAR